MRAIMIAFVLVMLGVVALLLYSDILNADIYITWPLPWTLVGPAVLLICTPISLALFVFLAHRQQERHKE
jgi:hypothetical protein